MAKIREYCKNKRDFICIIKISMEKIREICMEKIRNKKNKK